MNHDEAFELIQAAVAAAKADDDLTMVASLAHIAAGVIADIHSIADSLKTLAYVEYKRAEKEGVL